MGSILAVILVVAIIYFLYNYFKGTKPKNTPVKAAPPGKNVFSPSKRRNNIARILAKKQRGSK